MEPKCPSTYVGNKRPLKGLKRACWECKNINISQTDINMYSSMSTPTATERVAQENPCQLHIGERLGKLEQLFERFVCRKNSTVEPSETRRSPALVESSETQSKLSLPTFSSDAQSVSSIGDGIVSLPVPCLTGLLPSQHDADIIFGSSNGWMILEGIYSASKDIYVNRDEQSYALDMAAVAQQPSIIVARTLLHLAICINSLPPEFDGTRLQNIWSLDDTVSNYVTTVNSLVTNADEHMLTLYGLECLMLLAIQHMNSANLRQAWLVIRRAMNLAHLMGFHRIVMQRDLDPPVPAVSNAKSLWRHMVDLDRYLGLHLRLPFGADDVPVSENDEPQVIHRARINALSREIADLDRSITPQSYAKALSLDERLETNMREMPREFWEVPNMPCTARSAESFAALERLMVQMWHFELKIFVHLPYLLRAPVEPRYEFSKVTALQASRDVVMRWFALRNAGITQACCRLSEISVFMAAVTLTLDIVIELALHDKAAVQKAKGADFAMLCRLVGELDKLARASTREKIAARSAAVLKKMLAALDPGRQAAGPVRLTIPFFGTVVLAYRELPRRPRFGLDSETGRSMHVTGSHVPVFSFVKNELWPAGGRGDGLGDGSGDGLGGDFGDGLGDGLGHGLGDGLGHGLGDGLGHGLGDGLGGDFGDDLDWDVVLFDGLEDRDTEGNWVF
ncbi:uncharacterized protein M421DRAFT_57013 [Didymella exigua CBS 183.55]|uniref:Transcription factor domain-containing protein n=1 Tax=Didymella exigua CBS 183.55 TaxID=1150837 RepID=A0A6A5RVN4_9PLEO|nr:uncharacterized protein M421DRAFT_57013 [Didymella exigua CBS 183.55]KAF1931410.1 hypothetical protein M421DRAFT_57013 [Didymella exigua CBS 183.55]